MKLSIFSSIDAGANVEHEMTLVTTGDWNALMQSLKMAHNGKYVYRIYVETLSNIMGTLGKENRDILFISIVNNSVSVGFNGGLTVEFIINYNRDSIEVKYNLPTYC